MLNRSRQNRRNTIYALAFLMSLLFIQKTNAQTFSVLTDLDKIETEKLSQHIKQNHRPYIYKNEPASFKTLNPVTLTYGGLIYLYQNSISQHFSADCLYHPTCSDFSKQCVHEYGIIKGGLLTFDRLCRCNRIAGADIRPSEVNPKTNHYHDPIQKYK